jgi:hypothetical protein
MVAAPPKPGQGTETIYTAGSDKQIIEWKVIVCFFDFYLFIYFIQSGEKRQVTSKTGLSHHGIITSMVWANDKLYSAGSDKM